MNDPLVSIIIPTCRNENQAILDLCLESISRQRDIEAETIIISSCPNKPEIKAAEYAGTYLYHFEQRLRFPDAINAGVEKSVGDYLFLLNDDVILSRDCIAGLVEFIGDHTAMVNPLSNCDNGWMYQADFEIQDPRTGKYLENKRYYKLPEIAGFEDEIMHYPKGMKLGIQVPYLCFYATLIPRKVWNLVGKLDERYKAGFEDQDYCMRARQHNTHTFVTMRSFAFHFGGSTSSQINLSEETAKSMALYEEIHGKLFT